MDTRLSQMQRNEAGEVITVEGQGAVAQRLMAMGVLPGVRVKVIQVAPLGDPITIEINGSRVSLRRLEAEALSIRRH